MHFSVLIMHSALELRASLMHFKSEINGELVSLLVRQLRSNSVVE